MRTTFRSSSIFWALVLGCLHLVRLSRWCGVAVSREPLLMVLHIAYAWLGVGFLVLGLLGLLEVSGSAGIHALTTGAITTMILAVSSRAGMGHSGRELVSPPLLTIAFAAINLAALTRVAASLSGSTSTPRT